MERPMANPLVEALEKAVQHAWDLDIPLNEKLTIVADEVRSLSTVFADAVDRMVIRLKNTGAGETAPGVGDAMPPFVLPDERGRLVGLEELLVQGPVAISFNRGHWCPYCRLNVHALADLQKEMTEEGRQLVAIVPERRKFTSALKAEADAPFPVLTDMDNGYALSLNLAIWVGAEMEALIASAGWDVPAYQGNAAWMLPIPATFVVGADGLITARYLDPDYRKRVEIDTLRAALRAAYSSRQKASRRRATG
jgi:peroxiredoxin